MTEKIENLLEELDSLKVDLYSFCGQCLPGRVFDDIDKAIYMIQTLSEKLETQNLNGGWIPCSERLPENQGNVLVSCDGNVYVALFIGDEFILEPHEDESFYDLIIEFDGVAWMPLPEVWKGEK